MVAAPCSMSERNRLRADFIVRAGWADARESLLAGDASFRRYFRLTRASGPAVVTDAPRDPGRGIRAIPRRLAPVPGPSAANGRFPPAARLPQGQSALAAWTARHTRLWLARLPGRPAGTSVLRPGVADRRCATRRFRC